MNCRYVEKQTVKYIDGEITFDDFSRCMDHIDSCESCRNFYDNSVYADDLLNNYPIPLSSKTFDDLMSAKQEKHFYIPVKYVAAVILLAALLGYCFGSFVRLDCDKYDFLYAYSDITYSEMLEDSEG
ncbi:MAG: hypothetical protein KBT47_03045 [Armatimonadetes bacterium]|nr:hypothetical protein [Candidatus Hippobium faecium]